jgi:hypothetical protein
MYLNQLQGPLTGNRPPDHPQTISPHQLDKNPNTFSAAGYTNYPPVNGNIGHSIEGLIRGNQIHGQLGTQTTTR